jgi:hypothetical protein
LAQITSHSVSASSGQTWAIYSCSSELMGRDPRILTRELTSQTLEGKAHVYKNKIKVPVVNAALRRHRDALPLFAAVLNRLLTTNSPAP